MAILDPTVATLTAVSITPAIVGQIVPPAHAGPNPADRRRYQQAAAVSLFLGGALSLLAGQVAPLILSAGSVGALIALREWTQQQPRPCTMCGSSPCRC
jgi:alpha-beta hydrolase superfamily lysophospholipase